MSQTVGEQVMMFRWVLGSVSGPQVHSMQGPGLTGSPDGLLTADWSVPDEAPGVGIFAPGWKTTDFYSLF